MSPAPGANEVTVFHPIQTHNPPRMIPEAVALRAYEVYCHVFGPQPALIDLARDYRGGFGIGELFAFLYAYPFPKAEWRTRVDEALDRGNGFPRLPPQEPTK